MSSLGSRVAYVRRIYSVTQADLADGTGLSADFISKLETGKRVSTSMESLSIIARFLGVSVGYLWDGVPGADVREVDSNLIRPVTRLLLPVPHVVRAVDEQGLTVDKLRGRVVACTVDFDKARYKKVVTEVPALVDALRMGITIHENEARLEIYRLLAHAYIIIAQSLIWLRSEYLATYAIAKALEAAEETGDVVLRTTAVRNYSWAFRRLRMYDEAETIAVDMAELTEPSLSKAPPAELAVWGLLLKEASTAAIRRNRWEEAGNYLNLAHSVAVRMERGRLDYAKYWAVLHPSMIGITRADNALAVGDADLALRIGSTVHRANSMHLDMWTWHLLVMAGARLKTRNYKESINTMKSIRELAPEWTDNNRIAHDIVRRLLDSVAIPRAKATGLTDLARAMKVGP